jgi:hypothetical protein
MLHQLSFHLHADNVDNFLNTSKNYHQPLGLNSLISHHDFDPDFISATINRALNDNLKQIVLDMGCTFAVSPDKTDFITYHTVQNMTMIQTAGRPTKILGHGMVEWTLVNDTGNLMPIHVPCQHVPLAKMRLSSPQVLCHFLNLDCFQDRFGGNSNYFWLHGSCNCKQKFLCHIDPNSNLPVTLSKTSYHHSIMISEQTYQPITLCTKFSLQQLPFTSTYSTIMEDSNLNLSPAQKELLIWHCRLGHFALC